MVATKLKKNPPFKNGRWKQTVFLLFFIGLFLVVVDQVIGTGDTNQLLYQIFVTLLYPITLGFGGLSFYLHKEELNKVLDKEYKEESSTEKRRGQEFATHFPRLARITIVRNFIRYVYVAGFWRSLTFVFLIGIFIALVLPRLSYVLIGDEYFQFNAAAGYLRTGEFLGWDFIHQEPFIEYDRSAPTTFIFAVFMKVFGISPFAARLATLFSAILFFILSYHFIQKLLKNRTIAILSVIYMVTNLWYVEYASNIRMYIFLLPVALLYLFAVYKSIDINTMRIKLRMVIVAALLFWLGYAIHGTMAPLIVIPFAYYGYSWVVYSDFLSKHKVASSIIGLAALIFITAFIASPQFAFSFIKSTFPDVQNYVKSEFSLKFNDLSTVSFFNINFPIAFLIISSSAFAFYRRQGYSFLLLVYLCVHVGFAFLVDKHTPRYLSIIFVVNISLFIFSAYVLLTALDLRKKYIVASLVVFLLGINVAMGFSNEIKNNKVVFGNNYTWSLLYEQFSPEVLRPNYQTAIEKIKESGAKPGVVLGYLTPMYSYYLQEVISPEMRYYELKKVKSFYNTTVDNRDFTHEDIEEIKNSYSSGLIIWANRKDWHLSEELRKYIELNFKKISGEGVDESYIDIYYW